MRINQRTREYFAIADREDLAYEAKLDGYAALADEYFQAEAFEAFRADALGRLDEITVDYFESAEFDELLVRAIRLEVEPDRHEEMIERCRGLVGAWAADERAAV